MDKAEARSTGVEQDEDGSRSSANHGSHPPSGDREAASQEGSANGACSYPHQTLRPAPVKGGKTLTVEAAAGRVEKFLDIKMPYIKLFTCTVERLLHTHDLPAALQWETAYQDSGGKYFALVKRWASLCATKRLYTPLEWVLGEVFSGQSKLPSSERVELYSSCLTPLQKASDENWKDDGHVSHRLCCQLLRALASNDMDKAAFHSITSSCQQHAWVPQSRRVLDCMIDIAPQWKAGSAYGRLALQRFLLASCHALLVNFEAGRGRMKESELRAFLESRKMIIYNLLEAGGDFTLPSPNYSELAEIFMVCLTVLVGNDTFSPNITDFCKTVLVWLLSAGASLSKDDLHDHFDRAWLKTTTYLSREWLEDDLDLDGSFLASVSTTYTSLRLQLLRLQLVCYRKIRQRVQPPVRDSSESLPLPPTMRKAVAGAFTDPFHRDTISIDHPPTFPDQVDKYTQEIILRAVLRHTKIRCDQGCTCTESSV